MKLAGIKAKPGQVEQAWSALRSGDTARADDPRPPGGCGSGRGSGGDRGRLAAKLALAEMLLEPRIPLSVFVVAVLVVAVVTVVVVTVVVFGYKPGRRVRRLGDVGNGIGGTGCGKGPAAERCQTGFDGYWCW